MVSTWNDYLSLRPKDFLQLEIAVCSYEGLAEQEYDEEGEPIDMPLNIAGKPVVDVEFGIIVGGSLGCWDERHTILISSDESGFVSFAVENGFALSAEEHSLLREALGNLSNQA